MKFENFNENLIYKYKRYVWFIIWILFFRFSPFFLYGWRNFILKIFGARIGKNVHIYPSCKIYSPWNLIMLDNSTLGRDVDCYSYAKIKIGRNSTVSQRSFLCAASRNYKKKKQTNNFCKNRIFTKIREKLHIRHDFTFDGFNNFGKNDTK